jgi:hypothetical protein
MWSCGAYGSCLAMTSLLTSDALATQAGTFSGGSVTSQQGQHHHHQQQHQPGQPVSNFSSGNSALGVSSVPEDNIGEDPRSSWRLVTGHENGQLLLWNAALDRLQPLVKVGEPGSSPVRAVAVMEAQRVLAVVHANGDLALFARPARDQDWLLTSASAAAAATAAAAAAGASAGAGLRGSSADLPVPHQEAAAGDGRSSGAAGALSTIKPRRVVLKTHRSALAAASSCSCGIVTASTLGTIRLWPAHGLGREAERCGLVQPHLLHAAAHEGRCVGMLGCPGCC